MDKRKVYAASFLKDLSNLLDHYGATICVEDFDTGPRIVLHSGGTKEEARETKFVVRGKEYIDPYEADDLANKQLGGEKPEDCEPVKQAYQADPGAVPYTVTKPFPCDTFPGTYHEPDRIRGNYHYYEGGES